MQQRIDSNLEKKIFQKVFPILYPADLVALIWITGIGKKTPFVKNETQKNEYITKLFVSYQFSSEPE